MYKQMGRDTSSTSISNGPSRFAAVALKFKQRNNDRNIDPPDLGAFSSCSALFA